MHPGSNEYSMPIRRVVNKFLDESSRILVELFDRQNSCVDLCWNSLRKALPKF